MTGPLALDPIHDTDHLGKQFVLCFLSTPNIQHEIPSPRDWGVTGSNSWVPFAHGYRHTCMFARVFIYPSFTCQYTHTPTQTSMPFKSRLFFPPSEITAEESRK
jgi:hypothetical protein